MDELHARAVLPHQPHQSASHERRGETVPDRYVLHEQA